MLTRNALFALLAAAALGACTNSADLQTLNDRHVDVSVGNGISVWLSYDGVNDGVEGDCFTLDNIDATFNGAPADTIDSGEWGVPGDSGKGTCTRPYFTWANPPAGAGTLHLGDSSAAIDVTIPDALATRSVALADATLHNSASVTFVPSIPATDTVTLVEMFADETTCGDQLFDVRQDSPGSTGFAVTLPDADSIVSECDPTLAPVPATVDMTINTTPQVTTCSGATCAVLASGNSSVTKTFVP